MKAFVDKISLFFKGIDGWRDCPKCGHRNPKLISTSNKYDHYCEKCDIRYTSKGEIYVSS